MKLFKYKDFVKYSHDFSWLYNAWQLFISENVLNILVSNQKNTDYVVISGQVLAQNKYADIPYRATLKVKDNTILEYECECPVKNSFNKICKHCLALLIKYNYLMLIEKNKEINLEEYLNLSVKYDLETKAIVFCASFCGLDLFIKNVFDQVVKNKSIALKFVSFKDEQLQNAIENNNIILSIEKFPKFFNDIYQIIKLSDIKDKWLNNDELLCENNMDKILDFCFENNIPVFFYANQKTILVEKRNRKVNRYPNGHNFVLKRSPSNQIVKHINYLENKIDKEKYLNLDLHLEREGKHFYLSGEWEYYSSVKVIKGSENDIIVFFDHNDPCYFIVKVRKFNQIVSSKRNSEQAIVEGLFDRHPYNVSEFKNIKALINDLFGKYGWSFSLVDIEYLNLENTKPVLNIDFKLNEIDNVPYVDMYFKYDQLRVELFDIDEFENRDTLLEVSLLSEIKNINDIYDDELKGFVFKNERHFNKAYKWLKKFKDSVDVPYFYNINISNKIVYKEKTKRKYSVQVLNHGIDFIEVKWNIDLYSDLENKKIIEGYLEKKEFINVGDKKIDLRNIDFTDLENKLNFLNSDMKKFAFADQKMIVNQRYFVTFNEFKNDDKLVSDFINKLDNPKRLEIDIDKKIKNIIKPYQEYGIKWLVNHYQLKTGAILADEMGLGKTIQTIGMLNYIHSLNKDFKTLIVVPAALVYNWQKELSMYSNDLKTIVIDGNKTTRNNLYQEIDNYQVIVISYHTLNIDKDVFIDKQFETIIIDEGHSIKNKDTQISKTIKEIKGNFKVILSGTPMENNASEIWSLFDFIMTGYMNTFKNFKKIFAITKDIKTDLLKNKMKYFILRRTKKDVLKDLPEKFEKPIYVEMNNEQKKYYANILVELKGLKEEIGEENWNKNYIVFLERLMRLRQICSNPKLVDKNAKENGSKFDMCISLIKTILEQNQKVLIFSQFSSMFEYFIEVFDELNIKYHLIDGSTNKKKRLEYVESFNNSKDINVFLISLKAGGVGLNLTSATNVIHYDFWWNMSAENQATDRAHRIGQTNYVNVYKIITKDSIEEKIVELQKYKQQLINTLLDYNNMNDKNLSMKEIFDILKL